MTSHERHRRNPPKLPKRLGTGSVNERRTYSLSAYLANAVTYRPGNDRRCVGHPSVRGTLSTSVRNLLTAIGSGSVGARQAVERVNRLIDDAHLDYTDE